MELGFLLAMAASAGAGFIVRGKVGRGVGRGLLAAGLAASALGLGVLALAFSGRGPLGTLEAGRVAAVAFGVAALALPSGMVVSWSRPASGSAAGEEAGT